MEIQEIYDGINKLETFYSKELNETEATIWENTLLKMEKERFEKIINECFAKKSYMPKLANILEIDKVLPKKKVEELQQETVDCKYCQGMGIFEIQYEQNGNNYSFGARCICENGNKYNEFKSIKDYGLLRPDYFGNTSIYKLKPYVLNLIKNRLRKEKTM